MKRLTLIVLLLCLVPISSGQQHLYPAEDTANIFSNTNQFEVGTVLGPVTVSQLSGLTGVNTVIVVTDGTPGTSPCTGSGSGAIAVNLSGTWNCIAGTGTSGVSSITVKNAGTTLATATGAVYFNYLGGGVTGSGTSGSPFAIPAGGSGTVTGTGTSGYEAVWTSSTAIGSGSIHDAGTAATQDLYVQHQTSFACGGTTSPVTPGCYGLRIDENDQNSSTGAVVSVAAWFRNFGNDAASTWQIGMLGQAQNNFGVTDLVGIYGLADPSASSTVGTNVGVFSYAVSAGATIGTANEGMYAVSGVVATATTVPEDYTYYADSPLTVGTGTLTHHYGYYMADQTTGGSDNPDPHGFYEVGNAPNGFQGHINQISSGNWAGTCVFASGTTCSISYTTAGVNFASTPVVILTPVNPGSVTFTLTSSSNSGFTITGSSSNSVTVNWLAVGNPN